MAATQDLGEESASSRPSVSVKNLQIPFGVLAPNVWGIVKEQPAVVTVHLTLGQDFASAASNDALDQSTIHYGQLAKNIRSVSGANQTLLDLVSQTEYVCHTMSTRTDGSFKTVLSVISVDLPKASMSGERVNVAMKESYGSRGETEKLEMLFTIQDMKIMTLIGVNDYERTAPQPVVASLELSIGGVDHVDERLLEGLFKIEHSAVDIIQASSFETLEALGDLTIKQLQNELLGLRPPGAEVDMTLRLEKPKAIAFADAAVVEVRARLPATTKENPSLADVNYDALSMPAKLGFLRP